VNCSICQRELGEDTEDRYACRACEHHLGYVLEQLPAEAVLLQAQLAPYRSPRSGVRSSGQAHAPLPLDVRVVDLLATRWVPDPHGEDSAGIPIGPALVGWASLIADAHPYVEQRAGTWYVGRGCEPVPRTEGGIAGWARWLRLYLPAAVAHPRVAAMHDDLVGVLRRVRAITGTQPRVRRHLAPCPACQAFGLARTDGEWEIRCGVCGHRMDPDAYAHHASEVLPGLTALAVLATAREITSGAA